MLEIPLIMETTKASTNPTITLNIVILIAA